MRNFDENNVTAAVLERVGQAADPRVRTISEALVRHLHAFVREIEPPQDEWSAAIGFLTRTGHMCSEARQEFILLSDVLGVSMLVDAINHRLPDAHADNCAWAVLRSGSSGARARRRHLRWHER